MARKGRTKKKVGAPKKPKQGNKPASGPAIAADMRVQLAYELFDQDGNVADRVSPDEPTQYIHGFAQLIPGLEAALEGACAGEQLSIWLEPEEAFGEPDDEGILEVDRDELPDGVEVGDTIMAESPEGDEVAWRVAEVLDDVVVVDVNHPLAGQRVRFEVSVLSVRPASDAELEAVRAELDERIVYEGSTVYGSVPGAVAGGADDGAGSDLVQLRTKSADRGDEE